MYHEVTIGTQVWISDWDLDIITKIFHRLQLFRCNPVNTLKATTMQANNHNLILQEEEPHVLYNILIEACQKKVLEYDETHSPKVLEEIQILRKLIDRVFKLVIASIAYASTN